LKSLFGVGEKCSGHCSGVANNCARGSIIALCSVGGGQLRVEHRTGSIIALCSVGGGQLRVEHRTGSIIALCSVNWGVARLRVGHRRWAAAMVGAFPHHFWLRQQW
jgi:hypothetical protein